MLYRSINFWLLDLTASLLVFISAWYGKMTRGRMQLRGERETVSSASKVKPAQSDEVMTWNLGTTLWRLFLYSGYFRNDGLVCCHISVPSILYDLCSAHHGDLLHLRGFSPVVPTVVSVVSWRLLLRNLDCQRLYLISLGYE